MGWKVVDFVIKFHSIEPKTYNPKNGEVCNTNSMCLFVYFEISCYRLATYYQRDPASGPAASTHPQLIADTRNVNKHGTCIEHANQKLFCKWYYDTTISKATFYIPSKNISIYNPA